MIIFDVKYLENGTYNMTEIEYDLPNGAIFNDPKWPNPDFKSTSLYVVEYLRNDTI